MSTPDAEPDPDDTDLDTDPDEGEPAVPSVRDLPAKRLKVAGVEYTFRCPKLTAWAELAVPVLAYAGSSHPASAASPMLMFLHTALSAEESDALHRRKYDADDPLDLYDLTMAFRELAAFWGDDVQRIGDAVGMRLDINRRPVRASQVPRARPKARRR